MTHKKITIARLLRVIFTIGVLSLILKNPIFAMQASETSFPFPITFEENLDWTNAYVAFEGADVSIIPNPYYSPTNSSNFIAKLVKNMVSPWAGVYLRLNQPLNLDEKPVLKLNVWSPKMNSKLLLKIEKEGDQTQFYEVEQTIPIANDWVELSFDMSEANREFTYDVVTLFFDITEMGDGSENSIYYFDTIVNLNPTATTPLVTFQFDLSDAIAKENFLPSEHAVTIAGAFNNWEARKDTLTPSATEGIYEITFPLNSGSYEYKYLVSSLQFKPFQWDEGDNRIVIVDTEDLTVGPEIFSLPFLDYSSHAPENFIVHFSVDMSYQAALGNFDPQTEIVTVAGPFNEWNALATPLLQQENSFVYTGSVAFYDMIPGMETFYKFIHIQNETITWESFFNNRSFIFPDIDYSQFPRDEEDRIMISATDSPVWFSEEAPIEEPQFDNFSVYFQVDMSALSANYFFNPETDVVQLRTSYNDWSEDGVVLFGGENGVFTGNLILDHFELGGSIEYKYVYVNNQNEVTWEEGENRVFTIENRDYSGFQRDGYMRVALAAQEKPQAFRWTIDPVEFHHVFAMESTSIPQAGSFMIPITLKSKPGEEVTAVEFSFVYSEELNLDDISFENSFISKLGWSVETNQENGFVAIAAAGAEPFFGYDTLAVLYGHANEMALVDSSYPINFTSVLVNENFNEADYAVSDGFVTILGDVIEPMYGDVSLNGLVQAFDASLVLKALVQSIELSEQQLMNADVTVDKTLSALDAAVILQYVVGIVQELPIQMNEPTKAPQFKNEPLELNAEATQVTIPFTVSEVSSIYGFEAQLTYDTTVLTFIGLDWSNNLSDYIKTVSDMDGVIRLAGAGSKASLTDGSFGTLRFELNSGWEEVSPVVSIDRLRWNEGTEMKAVGDIAITPITTGLVEAQVPTEFNLEQNFPNPFNPSTTLRFSLPQASEVRLTVFNTLGQSVATVVNRPMNAGTHTVQFDASALSSGMYFYRIDAGSFTKTMKMMLIK